jgi:hypothetical protein
MLSLSTQYGPAEEFFIVYSFEGLRKEMITERYRERALQCCALPVRVLKA